MMMGSPRDTDSVQGQHVLQRASRGLRSLDRRKEVSAMVHPLDTEGLRRREAEARRQLARARARSSGVFAVAGATLTWSLTRLDTTRPMRVINLFLFHYGTVMAAGAAYMMFFSVAAALVAGFSVLGLVIGDSPDIQEEIVNWVDVTLPGVIDTGEGGLAKPETLFDVQGFNVTLIVSLIVLMISSLSWVHGLRSGIRSIWDRPLMDENVLVVKTRDLGLMIILAVLLLISGATAFASSAVAANALELLNLEIPEVHGTVTRLVGIAVPFVLDMLVALLLYRVASRLVMPVSVLWRAMLVAAVGSSALRLGSTELLAAGTTNNPVLAPFATVLGLFLFFFLLSLMYLLTASWASVMAYDWELRKGPGTR